ncbi:MAG: glycerophosphodiester phosphodiesterase [Nitrospiraceae bacterium]|nr:glycerophosphodiester phosphodiesterase [Nitrospiraceae bacterium]
MNRVSVRITISLAVAAAVCGAMPAALSGETAPPAGKPFFAKPLLLGAHRGGERLWPESTMVAFKSAAEQWPDILLESDAHVTADGHLVLLHDDTVDRTTDGSGRIEGMTLAKVRALDAGYRFTRDGGKTFPYRGKGLTIPTLNEVLEALPGSRFLIELKNQPGVAEAVVDVLRKTDAFDRVALASFSASLMRKARQLEPSLISCFDFINGISLLKSLRGAEWDTYRPDADILAVDRELMEQFKLRAEEIGVLRDKGIAVLIHTINNADQMRYFLDLGMTCILSDRPDLLADVIAERGSAQP